MTIRFIDSMRDQYILPLVLGQFAIFKSIPMTVYVYIHMNSVGLSGLIGNNSTLVRYHERKSWNVTKLSITDSDQMICITNNACLNKRDRISQRCLYVYPLLQVRPEIYTLDASYNIGFILCKLILRNG